MKQIPNCAILSICLSFAATLSAALAEDLPTQYTAAREVPIKGPRTINLYQLNADSEESTPVAHLESDGNGKIRFYPHGGDRIISLTLAQIEALLGPCSHPDHDYGCIVLSGRDDGFFEIRVVFKRPGGARNQFRPKGMNLGSSWGKVGPQSRVMKYQVINYYRGVSNWIAD